MINKVKFNACAKMSRSLTKSSDRLVQVGKRKIAEKLRELEKERDDILNILDDFVLESQAVAQPILRETDRSKFCEMFESVNQAMENRFSKLFLLHISLNQQLFSDVNEDSDVSFDDVCCSSPARPQQAITGVEPVGERISNNDRPSSTEQTSLPMSEAVFSVSNEIQFAETSSLPMSEPNISEFGYDISEPDDIPVKLPPELSKSVEVCATSMPNEKPTELVEKLIEFSEERPCLLTDELPPSDQSFQSASAISPQFVLINCENLMAKDVVVTNQVQSETQRNMEESLGI